MNTRKIGNEAEDAVCSYLSNKGYSILARNYFCRVGEIDIIAVKEGILCAVEVKKMPSKWTVVEISQMVSPAKMARIKKSLSLYLAQNQSNQYYEIRFDVAAVLDSGIQYWEGAF